MVDHTFTDIRAKEEYLKAKKFLDNNPLPDIVNHPEHYTSHPSGVECIAVAEHMNFCLGNAIKYIWRVDDKGDPIQNLEKAIWYLNREIARRQDKKINNETV